MDARKLFHIEGKTALITGGTRGIGFMIAQGLVQMGVKTYVTSRKAETCREAEAELRKAGQAYAIPADVADADQVAALAAEISGREDKLHILVNNAGTSWGEPFDRFPQSGWDKVMHLNLGAIFFLTQKLAPLLRNAATSDDPARVINIGSVDGLTAPAVENYPYSASKAAVHHLTRHLARFLAESHINVNAIAPGPFPTKMTEWLLQEHGEEINSMIPRRRTGTPGDAAGAAIFLASPASSYITGAVIPLDGGFSTTR